MIATLRTFILKRIPLIALLIIYLIFTLVTYRDFGLTMDEFFVYTRGQYFYNKVVGNDAYLQKGFAIHEEGNEDILYNNSSYPALLYAINNNQTYELYHLINMLIAFLIFILTYEMLLSATKNPRFAIIGPLFLFLTPRFLGHIPANPKDIPLAVSYFAVLAMIFLSRKWDIKLQLVMLGILVGLSASVRIIGFTLIPVYVLYRLLYPLKFDVRNLLKQAIHIVLESVIIFLIAFLVFMVNMPYVATDPINHLIELLRVSAQYPWYGDILFFGKTISFDQRPVWYLPVWILITTPLFILGLSMYGVIKKMNKPMTAIKMLILLSIGVHALFYLFLKPIIYNGLRHYLFLLPHIVLLATLGYIQLIKNKKLHIGMYITTGIFIVAILVNYWKLHPYEYTYFNTIKEILPKELQGFELDYWAGSDKEAMEWLSNYFDKHHISNVSVYSCSKSASLSYYMPQVVDVNTNIQKADYIVCYDKKDLSFVQEHIKKSILHEIKRGDVVYSTIFKVD